MVRGAGVGPFAAVSFAYFGFAGLFSTWAPIWYASLGFSTFAIGALVALQSATRIVAPYAWGSLADRSGRRERLLRVAAGGALIASLGFLADPAMGRVAAVCLVLSLCTAGVLPINETLLASRVTRDGVLDVGRYGRVRLWGSVGFVGAVTGSGFVLQAAGTGRFPWLASAMLLLLFGLTLRLPKTFEPTPASTSTSGALAVLREPVVAWFFVGLFFTVLAHTALYAFYSLHLASLGYAKGTIGLLWGAGVVAEVLWFAGQGRWLHRASPHRWLLVAALVSAVRFALIAAFASELLVLVAAQLLHALTVAAQHSACVAVVSRHFPGRLRARGQALYAVIGYGLSGVIGGLAGGALSQVHGFPSVFWAASAVSCVAAFACLRSLAVEAARGPSSSR